MVLKFCIKYSNELIISSKIINYRQIKRQSSHFVLKIKTKTLGTYIQAFTQQTKRAPIYQDLALQNLQGSNKALKMNANLSGSSEYYDEEDVSMRSDPPLLQDMVGQDSRIEAVDNNVQQPPSQNVNNMAQQADQSQEERREVQNNQNTSSDQNASDEKAAKENQSLSKPQKAGEDQDKSFRLESDVKDEVARSVTSKKSNRQEGQRNINLQSSESEINQKQTQQDKTKFISLKANDQKNINSTVDLRQNSPVFTGSNLRKDKINESSSRDTQSNKVVKLDSEQEDLSNLKVSDILTGNFAPIEIPILDIPGTSPLIYTKAKVLIAEINEKDEFLVDDIEEEFLMFTAEIQNKEIRRQDGPHQTLRWRKTTRNFIPQENSEPIIPEEQVLVKNEQAFKQSASVEVLNSVHNSIEGTELTASARNEPFFIDDEGSIAASKAIEDTDEEVGQGLNAAPLIGYEEEELEARAQKAVADTYVDELIERVSVLSKTQDLPLTSKLDETDIEEGLQMPILEPHYETIEDPVLIKQKSYPRIVQIESIRPIRESLEQIFVKEYESTWINDKQQYEDLATKKLASPKQKEDKKSKKNKKVEESIEIEDQQIEVEDEVIADEKISQEEYTDLEDNNDKDDGQNQSMEEEVIDEDGNDDDGNGNSIAMEESLVEEKQIADEDDDGEIGAEIKDEISEEQIKSDGITDGQFEDSGKVSNSASIEKLSVANQQQLNHKESVDVIIQESMQEDEEVIDELSEPSQQSDLKGEKQSDKDQDSNSKVTVNIKDDADDMRKVESQLTYDTKFSDDEKEQLTVGVALGATNTATVAAQKPTQIVGKKKKVTAAQQLKKRQETEEEREFAKLREQQSSKISQQSITSKKGNTSSSLSTYVKRAPQPKLMDKNKLRSSIGNQSIETDKSQQKSQSKPGVPRFKHSTQTDVLASANKNADQELPPPAKKPRVPTVPDHLRSSSQSPTPATMVRDSVERGSQASKKPRVPKVTEILPGAKIVLPQKSVTLASPKESKQPTLKKSPKKNNLVSKKSKSLLHQTPSMANIHKSSVNLEVENSSPRSPLPPYKTSLYTPSNANKITSIKRRLAKKPTKQQLPKKPQSNNKIILSPQEIEDRYGNIRVIKPTREEALQRLNNLPDAQSEIQSYATLPNDRLDSHSPESNHGGTKRNTKMPPLNNYNSKLPYEQHLVAQLFDAYRREGNQPSRSKIQDRHGLHSVRGKNNQINGSKVQMPKIMGAIDGEFEKQVFEDVNSAGDNITSQQKRQKSEVPFSTSAKSLHNHGLNIMDSDMNQSIMSGKLTLSRANFKDKILSNGTISKNAVKINQMMSHSPFSPTHYAKVLDGKQINTNSGMLSLNNKNSKNNLKSSKEKLSRTYHQDSVEAEDQAAQTNVGYKFNRHTVTGVHQQSSLHQLLKVSPSWVNKEGDRKQTIDGADKEAIFKQLKENSQAFQKNEKSHVQAFRKAQSIQKKNLDFISSTSSITLAPIKSVKGHFTARAYSLANPQANLQSHQERPRQNFSTITSQNESKNQSNNQLPKVQNEFFNTYAVLEEYGNQGVSQANKYNSRQSTGGSKHLIPMMHSTNQTDFKVRRQQKKPAQQLFATPYPALSANSIGSDAGQDYYAANSTGGKSGIPAIASGRNHPEEMAKFAQSNHSNFFPSFDSRGNVGIIEDSNEFSPIKDRKKPQKQQQKPAEERKTTTRHESNFNIQATLNDQPKDLSGRVKHGSKQRQSNLPSLQSNSRTGSIRRSSIQQSINDDPDLEQ